jgi:uncharacterized membrane protein YqiK
MTYGVYLAECKRSKSTAEAYGERQTNECVNKANKECGPVDKGRQRWNKGMW